MNDQKGSFISKVFFIPIAVVCVAGVFLLGYYAGKRQTKTNQNEIVVPLPDVVSENIPTTGDFTFFKTLSDRDSKTVSIELKPKPEPAPPASADKARQEQAPAKKEAPASARREAPAREEAASRQQNGKLRYTLQTASYQDKGMAERDARKMKQHGFAAFVVASNLAGKGTWYRVRLGSFANRASAEKLQKELRSKEGTSSVVLVE